jgi:hypothetical protein
VSVSEDKKILYYVTSYKVPYLFPKEFMVLYLIKEAHVTDVHHKLQPRLYVKVLTLGGIVVMPFSEDLRSQRVRVQAFLLLLHTCGHPKMITQSQCHHSINLISQLHHSINLTTQSTSSLIQSLHQPHHLINLITQPHHTQPHFKPSKIPLQPNSTSSPIPAKPLLLPSVSDPDPDWIRIRMG